MEENSAESFFDTIAQGGNGTVVTVGTFDGVHRGHLEVLRTLREYGASHALRPIAVTFDRHPLEIIAPERAPLLLQSEEERLDAMRSAGVEAVSVPFTDAVRNLTARRWMSCLRDRLSARALVTGYDNRFGSDGRRMVHSDYVNLGGELGLDVVEAPELPGVCSTAVRDAISAGDMSRAAEMLGHPYEVEGEVVEGRRLGRQIGFPTANLDISSRRLLPAPGVYAAYAVTDSGDRYPAVVNIGDNPTVGPGNPITVEANLIGFYGDLYGHRMRLQFIEHLRGECRFPDLAALTARIARDRAEAERILNESY